MKENKKYPYKSRTPGQIREIDTYAVVGVRTGTVYTKTRLKQTAMQYKTGDIPEQTEVVTLKQG